MFRTGCRARGGSGAIAVHCGMAESIRVAMRWNARRSGSSRLGAEAIACRTESCWRISASSRWGGPTPVARGRSQGRARSGRARSGPTGRRTGSAAPAPRGRRRRCNRGCEAGAVRGLAGPRAYARPACPLVRHRLTALHTRYSEGYSRRRPERRSVCPSRGRGKEPSWAQLRRRTAVPHRGRPLPRRASAAISPPFTVSSAAARTLRSR